LRDENGPTAQVLAIQAEKASGIVSSSRDGRMKKQKFNRMEEMKQFITASSQSLGEISPLISIWVLAHLPLSSQKLRKSGTARDLRD
jgi:hypothetical protein